MPADAPQDRTPNEWYDFTPDYSGSASIQFEGETPIEGDGAFTFSETGECKIAFECHDAEHSSRLDSILQGGQPGVILPGGPPRPKSITIDTSDGTFVADYRVFSTGHSMTLGAARNSSATFRAIGATFNASDASQPTCFALPLYNMLSPSFVTYPRAQQPEIAYHPLRIFPTPAGNPDPQTDEEGFRDVNWHNQLITFQIDSQVGFIEPLPDYRERAKQLRDGDAQSLITAVLVCNAVGRDCCAGDPATWFPIDLLNLLSLATGQRVGAPWIEYRAADGALVRRVHREFGRPSFNPGHALLAEEQETNTGYLVTQGFRYPDIASLNTRLLITHLINATRDRRSIDERLLSLFRAFEVIAAEQGVARTNLCAALDASNSMSVQNALEACRNGLRGIAAAATEPQTSVINRIADRARSAGQQDVVFGLATANAATVLGFHDATVLNGFTASNGQGWQELLSRLRGDVVHQGGLDLMSGSYDVQEVVRVANHLLDLLLRIVASRVGSQANYASAVFPTGVLRPIDWVDASTTCNQLIPK